MAAERKSIRLCYFLSVCVTILVATAACSKQSVEQEPLDFDIERTEADHYVLRKFASLMFDALAAKNPYNPFLIRSVENDSQLTSESFSDDDTWRSLHTLQNQEIPEEKMSRMINLPSVPGLLLLMCYHHILADDVKLAERGDKVEVKKSLFATSEQSVTSKDFAETLKLFEKFAFILASPCICEDEDIIVLKTDGKPHEESLPVVHTNEDFIRAYGLNCFPQSAFEAAGIDEEDTLRFLEIMAHDLFSITPELEPPLSGVRFDSPAVMGEMDDMWIMDVNKSWLMQKKMELVLKRVWSLQCLLRKYLTIYSKPNLKLSFPADDPCTPGVKARQDILESRRALLAGLPSEKVYIDSFWTENRAKKDMSACRLHSEER